MASAPVDALILDASQRQSLVTLSELGRAGLVARCVETHSNTPAFASRWCALSAVVPDFARDRTAYTDALLGLCSEDRPRALLVAHDGTIEAVRSRRADFERLVGLALAPEQALAIAVDKARTLDCAKQLGISTPNGALVTNELDVAAALAEVGLPAVIKPVCSWVEKDGVGQRLSAVVETTHADAMAAAREVFAAGTAVVVQEWLPGDREAVSVFCAQGRIWARFAQRADRTLPPLGGSSIVRQSIPLPPDVSEAAERLVLELGLDGYSEIEFRRDARGKAALMEINPRLSASVGLAVKCGVPFPRLMYSWASGETLTETSAYRTGMRMRWLGGDVSWLKAVLQNPRRPDAPSRPVAMRMFVGDFLRPTSYDYLSPEDPRPALSASSDTARRIRQRTMEGLSRAPISRSNLDTEVVVIGAGPYGLSIAAHLSGRGVQHEIFGEAMEAWRDHMPAGMYLKSEGFASNLSSPDGSHTLERFCADSGAEYGDVGVPVSLDVFTAYGQWFQQRQAPGLRPARVEHVRRSGAGFELELRSGETLRSSRVVVAAGLQGCLNMPTELLGLQEGAVSHTYGMGDPASYLGEEVAVLGAGQSAIETAVLLHEHGARVRLISRTAALKWNPDPVLGRRSLLARMRHPRSGLGDGLALRFYADHAPSVHAMPKRRRREIAYSTLGPAGAWWLRPRFEDRVEALLGRTVTSAEGQDGSVRLMLDGSDGLNVTRVVAGTGYTPRLGGQPFLDDELRRGIVSFDGAPVLDRHFQSSVPGLYFAGYLAAASFGPVMRFVFGAETTARRIARHSGR
jgi:cation diffusion facilitator CzcD-associated flavoprotein CzcO/predicted ATP-grasp superfamily ATP-dependent carboligase